MAMIKCGVRKPKSSGVITVCKNGIEDHTRKNFGQSSLIETIRDYISGINDAVINMSYNEKEMWFNYMPNICEETKECLVKVKEEYLDRKKNGEDLNVYFNMSESKKGSVIYNIYLIDKKNINLKETVINNDYGNYRGDHIVLNNDAEFKDEHVFTEENNVLFFDKKNGSLVVAVHPKDISDLKVDKNFHLISGAKVLLEKEGLVIKQGSNVIVKKYADREKIENEEKNKKRLVATIKRSAYNGEQVELIQGNKKEIIGLELDKKKLSDLKKGRYNVYIPLKKGEFWLIINTLHSFSGDKQEYFIVDKGNKEALKFELIDLFI